MELQGKNFNVVIQSYWKSTYTHLLENQNGEKVDGNYYLCMKCYHIGALEEAVQFNINSVNLYVGEVLQEADISSIPCCEKCGNTQFVHDLNLRLHNIYLSESDEWITAKLYGQKYNLMTKTKISEDDKWKTYYSSPNAYFSYLNFNKKDATQNGTGLIEEYFLSAKEITVAFKFNKKTKQFIVFSNGSNKFTRTLNYGKGFDDFVTNMYFLIPEFYRVKIVNSLLEDLHEGVLKEWNIKKDIAANHIEELTKLLMLGFFKEAKYAGMSLNKYNFNVSPYVRSKLKKVESGLEFYRTFIPDISPKYIMQREPFNPHRSTYVFESFYLSLITDSHIVLELLKLIKKSEYDIAISLDSHFLSHGRFLYGTAMTRREIKKMMNPQDFNKSFLTMARKGLQSSIATLGDTLLMHLSLDDVEKDIQNVLGKGFLKERPLEECKLQLAKIQEYKKGKMKFSNIKRWHDYLSEISHNEYAQIENIPYSEEDVKLFNFTYNNYTFTLPDFNTDLQKLGKDMAICVGSYSYRAIIKELTIVAVRNKEDKPVLCLEIDETGRYLYQVKKSYNRILNIKDAKDIELIAAMYEYIQKTGLKFKTDDMMYSGLTEENILSALNSLDSETKRLDFLINLDEAVKTSILREDTSLYSLIQPVPEPPVRMNENNYLAEGFAYDNLPF